MVGLSIQVSLCLTTNIDRAVLSSFYSSGELFCPSSQNLRPQSGAIVRVLCDERIVTARPRYAIEGSWRRPGAKPPGSSQSVTGHIDATVHARRNTRCPVVLVRTYLPCPLFEAVRTELRYNRVVAAVIYLSIDCPGSPPANVNGAIRTRRQIRGALIGRGAQKLSPRFLPVRAVLCEEKVSAFGRYSPTCKARQTGICVAVQRTTGPARHVKRAIQAYSDQPKFITRPAQNLGPRLRRLRPRIQQRATRVIPPRSRPVHPHVDR